MKILVLGAGAVMIRGIIEEISTLYNQCIYNLIQFKKFLSITRDVQ